MEVRPARFQPLSARPGPRRETDGFSGALDLLAEPATGTLREAASTAAVGLDPLLLLQEHETEQARNRAARDHAEALLDALRGVQLGLLGAGLDGRALLRLDQQAAGLSAAADPVLAAAFQAIRQRSAVELARLDMERQGAEAG